MNEGIDQRISVLTIGAEDLAAMKDFYGRILGWKPLTANDDIVFYQLNGLLLSLCDRKLLGDFIGVEFGKERRAVTIGCNVATREEVVRIYERLRDKVKILKAPTEPPFGGLFFYFSDVEGNVIEVAYNPFVVLDAGGNAIGHQPIEDL